MNVTEKTAMLNAWIDEAACITAVCHVRPDGDAAGSCAALASYLETCRGKDAAILFPSPVPESVAFVTGGFNCITDPAAAQERLARTGLLLFLDLNTPSRTEAMEAAVREFGGHKVLIDHHEDPDLSAFDLCFSKMDVSSTCELLFAILKSMPDIGGDASKLPPEAARALMTGMTTDTNNFANSVYPGTLQMASELLAAGVDRDDILDRLYFSERPNRLAAQGEVLGERMKLIPGGGAVIVLPQSFIDRHGLLDGETEGFVNMPLAIKDVRLSLLAREDGEFFRVSIRSKKGVSSRELAKTRFHGGGHEQAAGGKILIPQDLASAGGAEAYVSEITARFLQDAGLSETR